MDKAAVVIPYYHNQLSEFEKISFHNCFSILGNYPICLLVPESMPMELYPKDYGFLYERVPDYWLNSVASYNQMMLNKEFYIRFQRYKYILIFQLDAFVFSDCLERFCSLGYDYIGAPWLKGWKYLKDFNRGVWHVGNGGFSLRKVSSFLNMLDQQSVSSVSVNEDIFWASCDSPQFHVAPLEIALQFSFEQDVRQCYLRNHNQLPFGCHAWEKYDFDFWRPFFREMGYFPISEIPEGIDKKNKYQKPKRHYLEAEPAFIKLCLERLSGKKADRIFVFGAGEIGKECGWLIRRLGMQEVKYLDNNPNLWGCKIWDILIEPPETLKDVKRDSALVIITANGFKDEILGQLAMWDYQKRTDVILYSDLIECVERG